jgi:hypothetical protein
LINPLFGQSTPVQAATNGAMLVATYEHIGKNGKHLPTLPQAGIQWVRVKREYV